MLWNGNDCATIETAAGGENLHKSVPPTAGNLADAARLKQLFEVNFDTGYVFGAGSQRDLRHREGLG